MSASSSITIVITWAWQGTIALAAGMDMAFTGLPAAVFTVAWLAACAGPIVPSRLRWSNAKQLGVMLAAGGGGLLIGAALSHLAPTPRFSAECLSFGVMSAMVSVIASLPAAMRFAMEDSAAPGIASPATASA